MASLPTLPCKECGHPNEGERVYCHNCGVKLDRSHLAEAAAPSSESIEQQQRRVKKMMNPEAGIKPRRIIRNAVRTLALAALAAAIIDVARPPEGVPEASETGQARSLATLLGTLAKAPPNMRLVLKQDEINEYLRTTIQTAEKQKGYVKFSRVYTTLDEEGITIALEQKVLDYPIHIGRKYALGFRNGTFEARPIAAHAGRLTIPEVLYPTLDKLFETVWTPLRQEHELVKLTGGVETGDEQIIFYSMKKPAASPATPTPSEAEAPVQPVVAPPGQAAAGAPAP